MRLKPHSDFQQPEDLLEGWKAIADYLHRDIRTARRWERTREMPVHRAPGGRRPGVYSSIVELTHWRQQACPPRTIAVLPFVNLAHDAETQSFADGLTDEIIAALTTAKDWQVAARRSSFAVGEKLVTAREIGLLLGVRLLLDGSVQRADGLVRVTAQLEDAERGYQLWSGQYDRPLIDIFAVEDDLARAIVAGILHQFHDRWL